MPIKIEKILVPIDFSDHSRDALVAALSLKKEFEAKIISLHAFDISELLGLGWTIYGDSLEAEVVTRMEQDANKALKEFLSKNDVAENEIRAVVSRGKPFVETVRLAKSEDVDLIVMGTHGRKGLEHLLMGSNAERWFARRHVRCLPSDTGRGIVKCLFLCKKYSCPQISASPLKEPCQWRCNWPSGMKAPLHWFMFLPI